MVYNVAVTKKKKPKRWLYCTFSRKENVDHKPHWQPKSWDIETVAFFLQFSPTNLIVVAQKGILLTEKWFPSEFHIIKFTCNIKEFNLADLS